MIGREKAIELVRDHIKTENTVKHMLATEAIMRALARKFEPEKEELWGLAGLLHDLDYEEVEPQQHTVKTIAVLKEMESGLPQEVYDAIQAHNSDMNPAWAPKTKMGWSLFIIDSLTGLIVATALVRPDKKLASVETKSVLKKFKEKSFAAGTRREQILLCEERLGLSLEELVSLSLEAMQAISEELGL